MHSCRSDPIKRSTRPFCQGERNDVGRSRIPIAPTRALNAGAKGSVIVANEILRCRVPWERFSDLARQPLGRRIAGHCKPQQLPTFVTENKKCKELVKRNRRNHEQINRRKIVRAFFADAALVSGRDFHPMVHPNEILTSRSNT